MQEAPDASVAGNADNPLVQAICEMEKGDAGEDTAARERLCCPMLETATAFVPDCPPKSRLPTEKYATGALFAARGGVAATTGVSTTVMASFTEA
jgi:hypothetical protein